MGDIRRLVVDVLKPHEPPVVEFTQAIAEVETVDAVTTSLVERDKEVQNLKLSVEGSALEYDGMAQTIERLGGTVHSIDEVACGEYIVEDRQTPQD
jgi:hypothetical protein